MSVSFASLVSDVYSLTNRPDLVNETALAVRAATIRTHQSDDYIKDFQEFSIQFSSSEFIQSLDYKNVIPLWRKPRYIRKYDAVGSTAGKFFSYVEPEEVIDGYGADRLDIFYVAGMNVQIKSSTSFQYALVGAYVNPVITSVGYSSWIADDHTFAIVYDAATTIFKTIGYDEQASIYTRLVAEQLQLLKQHAVTGLGM